jgi:hypothetical protein
VGRAEGGFAAPLALGWAVSVLGFSGPFVIGGIAGFCLGFAILQTSPSTRTSSDPTNRPVSSIGRQFTNCGFCASIREGIKSATKSVKGRYFIAVPRA